MRKIILLLTITSIMIPQVSFVFCEEYEKFQIKHGMYEKIANEKYGQPIQVEKLKSGFLPISKKKALYKINESDYMILYFFLGRVTKITLLENMDLEEATGMFQQQ